ncbi:uncharacterized protein [Ptychodera flava]|uniref:uncharacterized protein n=1 Tax=Ptychodera flava TaxID=63121 RepID=UPI00396A4E0D
MSFPYTKDCKCKKLKEPDPFPAHTVTSLYRCLLAEQTENEAAIYVSKTAGYHELWETYQYIRDVKGQTPMVIDSDDNLLYDPATTMKKFCDFAGFEFKESMLHWKPGPVEGWSWPFAGDWYSSVMNSSGFVTHEVHDKASQVDVGSYPELIQKTIRDSELYYEKLYNLRTKPSS